MIYLAFLADEIEDGRGEWSFISWDSFGWDM